MIAPPREVPPAGIPFFARLDATGADLRVDAVAGFRAFRPEPGGSGRKFEEFANPFPRSRNEAASARLHRRYGITGNDLRGKPSAEEVAGRFADFVGEGPVVCFERARFMPWFERLLGARADRVAVLGVADLARLVLPGRAAADPQRLLAGRRFGPGGPAPEELPALLAALLVETSRLPRAAFNLLAALLAELPDRYEERDPGAARHLRTAFELLDRPLAWAPSDDLFRGALPEGTLSAARRPLGQAIEEATQADPRFGEAMDGLPEEPLPNATKEAVLLDEAERRAVDLAFAEVLPRGFMAEAEGEDPRLFYRKGQHDLGRRVADHLERGDFLVVDAPTGTGKTLAYLVPALLWARRAGVRLAVSTFTRSLQEQAFEREIPRAVEALAQAGVEGDFRVSLLKGRANYVCGRKVRALAPQGNEDAGELLAWGIVCLFHLCDASGDLDRLPALAPIPTGGESAGGALRRLREEVRAESGCCTRKDDRRRCAAEVARRAAERAHLVVTNHAFVLSAPEFFRHAIFDECEHLHDQARSADEVEVRIGTVDRILREVHEPGLPRARTILREVERGTRRAGRRARGLGDADEPAPRGIGSLLEEAAQAWEEARDALESFDREVERFARWRERETARREEREAHALLREYASKEEGRTFLEARVGLSRALSALEAALAGLAEELEIAPMRGAARLRVRIGRARAFLAAEAGGLEGFLPVFEGEARFDPGAFYDVEEDPFRRGGFQCVRRVLLPNEFLGKRFLPAFRSAAFVSAANHLGGSFEAAEAYLGLDLLRRAPHPDTGEPGRAVESFRAPGTLDYGRVLLAVPADAPPFRNEPSARSRFLAYVAEFVRFLGVRTGGRLLVLFTSNDDLRKVAGAVASDFRAAGIPFLWQGMEGQGKEELAERFRESDDAVLMGLDTFWFGVDFPGAAVEYLVLVKLPYGRLDRYFWAQCSALGEAEHRRRIYLPRALGMFRQGFGRLLRRREDRGAVFVLDRRVLDGRGRGFLAELPGLAPDATEPGPRVVAAGTEACAREAFAHMGVVADLERRGLPFGFPGTAAAVGPPPPRVSSRDP
ncbi:MAG TPA: helicase C-terminal domain-containing protein [Planctomycetota bacterium]|jgi:Rad3-related DNA helicase|nr:helicase C-terminal domain-containing protein [Planctomycetota bacterium]